LNLPQDLIVDSFKIFWDLGRWLIIAGQSQKALAAQYGYTLEMERGIWRL
jgi:hypothetical protein